MPFRMPRRFINQATPALRTDRVRNACAHSCLIAFALAGLLVLTATTATAGAAVPGSNSRSGEIRGYDYEGFYGQFALSIGRIDFDGGVDSDASGGFGLTAGYRALPWLSGEAHFQFLGGQDNADDEDSQFFAFTFGPKIYPLGLIDVEEIPDTIQPYAFIGIGGGEGEIDGADARSSFVARFILGIDVWATDNVGFFVEGGGLAADDDDIDGAGVFSVGAQYRF